MDALPFDPRFEGLINDFLEKGFGVSQELFTLEEITSLRKLALKVEEQNDFRLAGVGDRFNVQKEKSIRTDKILWLNRADFEVTEQIFFQTIDRFIDYLNISCYAGIRSSEFHYAIYEAGTYYKRHSDQFKNNDQRAFSLVLYLTEDWRAGDGGELLIYKEDEIHTIQPMGGRLVFFDSSLEHEVSLSKAKRISLTGWLRRN